jgi:hypothetical protein
MAERTEEKRPALDVEVWYCAWIDEGSHRI